MITSIFPNGRELISSALTQQQVSDLVQSITCYCFNITDQHQKGLLVRQAWPKDGAPAYKQNDNITFISCQETDGWYNKVRDEDIDPNDDVSAAKVIEYTRIWAVNWELRGPSSFERGTLLKTAMQLDFIHDMFAASNLYLVPNVGNPVRAPEYFEGKWWDRSDLSMTFYEQVNESVITPTVASIQVIVETNKGIVLEIDIPE